MVIKLKSLVLNFESARDFGIMIIKRKLLQENRQKSKTLSILVRTYEKLDNRKSALEESILIKLEDQICNDNATVHLNASIRQLREKHREMVTKIGKNYF